MNWRTSRLHRSSSLQALTGVLPSSSGEQESLFGTRRLRPWAASRQTGKRRAHPIELTAVSAIVLDLLSGFQRPSRRSPDLHQSGDGPTLLRSASEAVKHPLWAGTPVVSRTCTSIRAVFWRPSERTQPAADPEVVRPRGRPTYSRGRTLSTWRFDCGSSPARPPRPLPSPDHHEGRAR